MFLQCSLNGFLGLVSNHVNLINLIILSSEKTGKINVLLNID